MGKYVRRAFGLIAVLVIAAFIYIQASVLPRTDAHMNPVAPHEPYTISPKARALHETLYVADLHSDTLLWRRNPEKRHKHGHVDLPRLRDGSVDLQVFSAVTKSPRGLNYDTNTTDAPDNITALAIAQLWPVRTWGSLYERAAYQAQRLQKIAANPSNRLIIARSKSDITNAPQGLLVTVLLTEGAHPLEGELDNIDRLFAEGYRAMGLTHFFDNEVGGSMHGISQAGLTDFGKAAVDRMATLGITIDAAHASTAMVRDVLDRTDAPLIMSHGGVLSHCPRTANRNLPDDIMLEMANRGSLIGIGFWDGAVCDTSPAGIADAISYAVTLLGEDNIALGSDFDGAVTTEFDTSELAAITDALLNLGMPDSIIRKVMGENAKRFFSENLPD